MHIGELARSAQVNIQTIRFYEREGLLPRPARTAAGYRSYEAGDLERVIFIKRNQELGFTLAEIQQLFQLHEAMLRLSRPPRHTSHEVQAIITMGHERLRTINQKIRSLHDIRRKLAWVIGHLEKVGVTTCPVVKSPAKQRPKKI